MTVFCDETGTHRCKYFAWGSIWCPTSRVAEMSSAIDRICHDNRYRGELGWKFAGRHGGTLNPLVDWFFATPWVCFQSLFVEKSTMRVFAPGESRMLAERKLLCTLLTTQTHRFDSLPGGPRTFRCVIDEASGSTQAMTEQELRILLASVRAKKRDVGEDGPNDGRVVSLSRVDSRAHRGVQLADLFVGGLRAAWEQRISAKGERLFTPMSRYLGWPNLRATTRPNLKFNVWLHRDSARSASLPCRRPRLLLPDGDPERRFRRATR